MFFVYVHEHDKLPNQGFERKEKANPKRQFFTTHGSRLKWTNKETATRLNFPFFETFIHTSFLDSHSNWRSLVKVFVRVSRQKLGPLE